MSVVQALFSNPEAAQRAVDSLREAGLDPNRIVVVTSRPYEEYVWAQPVRRTRMWWWASLGGLLGAACGYGLTAYTQRAYPLITGGMSLVTGWTNAIIIYELGMLGVILATLLSLLLSARLPGRRKPPYDPEIFDGKILVGVTEVPDADRAELERKLRRAAGIPA